MAVALPKIGFNEGSLLRRTLLHVGTFLLGSVAFIGIVSFVLVTVARSVVAPKSDAEDTAAETASSATPRVARPPTVKLPARGKRPAHPPATNATPPAEE